MVIKPCNNFATVTMLTKRHNCYICRLLGQTEEAVSSLIKAYDILRISHGTSTPFMKDLSEKLDEARAEASYKLLALKDGN